MKLRYVGIIGLVLIVALSSVVAAQVTWDFSSHTSHSSKFFHFQSAHFDAQHRNANIHDSAAHNWQSGHITKRGGHLWK